MEKPEVQVQKQKVGEIHSPSEERIAVFAVGKKREFEPWIIMDPHDFIMESASNYSRIMSHLYLLAECGNCSFKSSSCTVEKKSKQEPTKQIIILTSFSQIYHTLLYS